MHVFIFRTAIPFGYVGFWGGLFVVAVAALVLLGRGIRSRRAVLVIGGGLVVVGVVAFAAINVAAEKRLDLNPVIHDRMELAGQWHAGTSALDLRADGTFVCQGGDECSALGPRGTWSWRDFEITFRGAKDVGVVRRVVRYDRELRLASIPGDPDEWNGRFSFRRRFAG
jgi:hypothetical protein